MGCGNEQEKITVRLGKHVPDISAISGEKAIEDRICDCVSELGKGNIAFTGWVNLPENYDRKEFEAIKKTAEEIKASSQLLVVIGIGGSYLGAKAVIEALAPEGNGTKIVFAGCNLSAQYHTNILKMIEENETSICVISKSGTTTEPALAFAIYKEALAKKYGPAEAAKRIYAITDARKGTLREEADKEGYTTFVVPDDIGGRYSVLTPVGLLPIAVAGIDIGALLEGAAYMRSEILNCQNHLTSPDCCCAFPRRMHICTEPCGQCDISCTYALKYAMARFALAYGAPAKSLEIFEYYEPRLQYFAEWLKQLFGESEGKEGKGIFPASLFFSADLHSMGQFLQEGKQLFFETVLDVKDPGFDLAAPASAGGIIAGHTMNEVERAATEGVITAHENAGIPVIRINLPDLSENTIGQMIYFFEMNCAVTAMLTGVDPFNQPGVEAYKAEMKAAL